MDANVEDDGPRLNHNSPAINPTDATTLCCLMDHESTNSNNGYVNFTYLNEGGANVVFKIHEWQHTSGMVADAAFFADMTRDAVNITPRNQLEFKDKVLRVNKGLKKTLRCDEVATGFYNDVRPLFMSGDIRIIRTNSKTEDYSGRFAVETIHLPNADLTKHLMDHHIVALFPGVMADLTRKSSAIVQEIGATSLTTKRWGIILPNMSSSAGSGITLEFKPKWLLQSPNAPASAIRCRTCALQCAKPRDPTYLCPLWFVAKDQDTLYPWLVPKVLDELAEASSSPDVRQRQQAKAIAKQVVTCLTSGEGFSLLQHLKILQNRLDPHGVLRRKEIHLQDIFDRNLRLAMTLRDCSMYIKVSYDTSPLDSTVSSTRIECKLGDLDFKSADKINDWEKKERALLDGAAYTREDYTDVRCLYPALYTKRIVHE